MDGDKCDDVCKCNCDIDQNASDTDYVNEGMLSWLNNQPKQAEVFLKNRINNTSVLAAYSFVLCMNGIISSELDKIREAQEVLKSLERRCITSAANRNSNSIYSMWLRTFYKRNVTSKKLSIETIEEQIILADAYLLTAALSFLTEDTAGLIRGSWLLRKAWKIYNKNYCQIYELYSKYCANDANDFLPPPSPPPPPSTPSDNFCLTSSKSVCDMTLTPSDDSFLQNDFKKSTFRDNLKQCTPIKPNQKDVKAFAFKSPELENTSDNNMISANVPSKTHLHLDLDTNYSEKTVLNGGTLTCPSLPAALLPTITPMSGNKITADLDADPSEIRRLMGAVSFGYGIFQLCSSLLPTKILKIFNFLGFVGVQSAGIACLMFSRTTNDVRSIMATLVLLWYYTFGTQLFPNEDGYASDKITAATQLLDECSQKYPNAGLLLFFRGRLERMKTNIVSAIEFFENSYTHSAQMELKLLCLHEMAWCNLIRLDFETSANQFDKLRYCSSFSRAFYTYMACVCHGAAGNFTELTIYRNEISGLIMNSKFKETNILKFLINRSEKLCKNSTDIDNQFYFRYLAYELLYLWSAFSSMRQCDLQTVYDECSNMKELEPIVGLCDFLAGAIASAMHENVAAIDAFKSCNNRREKANDNFMHISVLSHVELAQLLLQANKSAHLQDAKKLLTIAYNHHNYDFENRFSAQIQRELKSIQ